MEITPQMEAELQKAGWRLLNKQPLTIHHTDGSKATHTAAKMVIDQIFFEFLTKVTNEARNLPQ